MCDGKHSSKRDVVILSIKPKRPEYPISQKVVPVSELHQEWDKLDAYYRGQLLKVTKSLKQQQQQNQNKKNRHHSSQSSPHKVPSNKHCKTSPVNKKHSSSLSSDQFTELFGDENLFSPAPPDSNNNSRHNHGHNKSKLLHSRSLNSLFDDGGDSDNPPSPSPTPPPPHRSHRKSAFSNVKNNLLVSIPVLAVQGDIYNHKHCGRRTTKYASDEEEEEENDSADSGTEGDNEDENFLSVPRDNFQVQYGIKQKTRVALVEAGNVSPRWIVPIRVAPYKPPTAQGLNGIQIQKILYHKNDTVNFASPTTTTARTPDKPPDNPNPSPPALPSNKSAKVTESPASTVSPCSTRSANSATTTPSSDNGNNQATPKQELSPPQQLDQGNKPATTSMVTKLSSPPVNSTTADKKLKRPHVENLASGYGTNNTGNGPVSGIKKRRFGDSASDSFVSKFTPVTSTSSTYPFQSKNPGNNNEPTGNESNSPNNSDTATSHSPKKPLKNLAFVKPSPSPSFESSSSSAASGDQNHSSSSSTAVFRTPAAVSITDRIIKKATRPQPELIERQRRRRLESNQRKTYAMQKGDEHEQRESIDLSMKSFEMIWNVPLLSPLRSP